MNSRGDEYIVVCNFKPHYHCEYKFGVPYAGDYEEVFSTDEKEFGGDGILNGILTAVPEENQMHSEDFSLAVRIAPMSAFFLRPLKKSEKSNKNEKAEKSEKTEK
jgi:1,4-alpha-glucan branching enzyme